MWHFFFSQVKCEAKSALPKPKSNNSNCKKGSSEDKSKIAVGEECRADEQAFLVALYKYMKERKTPIERIPYLGFKQSKYPFSHFFFCWHFGVVWLLWRKHLHTKPVLKPYGWGDHVYIYTFSSPGISLSYASICISSFWGSCCRIFIGLNPLIMTRNRHAENSVVFCFVNLQCL